ncbi:N-acetyltransferase [Gordonia desulfuricans]|uniref:N-acetyltransferase n=1 Tax=Gordonia desulfuricans TaxID=89051 RepID=A0A7K3LNQ9_9ACTN|nr:GNAT family N-acetyltransferase [Gordonia desulfuricans]NDK89187.1 N-acetyltransferase [Gordonia desulfuricans]
MEIRDALAADAEAICDIYNDAVAHSTAIWNDRLVDVDDRRAWMAERQRSGFPVLVAVDGAAVLGYATYGPFRPHDGFRHSVEHSVYLHADARGRGLGTALMQALIVRARAAGVHVMVAAIDGANTGSIRLHERLGFTHAGALGEVGTKFGSWLDLVFLQLTLDTGAPGDGPRDA